jgi:hypothetical protein
VAAHCVARAGGGLRDLPGFAMSDRITLCLWNAQQGYQELLKAWTWAKAMLTAGHRLTLILRKETRSVRQNRLMWSCLTDLSKQVKWFGKYLTPEGWKDFITGHLNGQELVPNMDGTGFISLTKGRSTSDMTIAEMTAVIDLCHAFGAEQGVAWSKTSLGRDEYTDPETGEILLEAA